MSSLSQNDPMSWSSSDAVRTENNQLEDDEQRFLKELKSLSYTRYLYQKDMVLEDPELISGHYRHVIIPRNARKFEINKKLGYPIIKAMDLGSVKHYSYSELKEYTDNFSKSNYIRSTVHGRLYRGTINNQVVIVKTCKFSYPPTIHDCYHPDRIHDELIFLRDPEIKSHPNVVKLIGYHCEQRLAVIYEGIRPVHFLDQLGLSDELKWKDRMKVAIEIGSILKMFHDKRLVFGFALPGCFMLDEKFNLMAFDFERYLNLNKLDIYHHSTHCSAADRDKGNKEGEKWSVSDDVYTYGLLLMELITKEEPSIYTLSTWKKAALCDPPQSVVHKSLGVDEEIGSKITKLADGCLGVKKNVEGALDIGMVVEELKTLQTISEARTLQNLCEVVSMHVKKGGGFDEIVEGF